MKDETALPGRPATTDTRNGSTDGGRALPSPADRFSTPDAFLSRTDLRALGLERRAVDSIFRACPVVVLPGYARPLIRVSDYLGLIAASTYSGDRVRVV